MPVDFTKFPFSGIANPKAATLLEALAWPPSEGGFMVVTLKSELGSLESVLQKIATSLRAGAAKTGFVEMLAFKHLNKDEMGGAVPFDQPVCDYMLQDAERHLANDSGRYMALKNAVKIAEKPNPVADWVILLEYMTPDKAVQGAADVRSELQAALQEKRPAQLGISVCRNAMRYAHVSRDPNVISFFNLFPAPGDPEALWPFWQEATPWFFEVGEVRSSFPLVAVDGNQDMLLVNYAHFDSVKHFWLGAFYDPKYLEIITHCYSDQGFKLPMPFFCKIVAI